MGRRVLKSRRLLFWTYEEILNDLDSGSRFRLSVRVVYRGDTGHRDQHGPY
jgi:hypothetical protein